MTDQTTSEQAETPIGHPGAGMDAALKAKWVEALRSGDYRQGEGQLHNNDNDTFCCLGVLCVVMGAAFGPAHIEYETDDGLAVCEATHVPVLNGEVLSSGEDNELSRSLERRLGINQNTLISMNDGSYLDQPDHAGFVRKHSFSEIADYIEQHIPTVGDRNAPAPNSEVA